MKQLASALVFLLLSLGSVGCAGTHRFVAARIPLLPPSPEFMVEPTERIAASSDDIRLATAFDLTCFAADSDGVFDPIPQEVVRKRVRKRTQERARVRTDSTRDDSTRLLIGIGFTTGPETFALGVQADIPVGELLIGPQLQVGVSGDDGFVALAFNVKKEIEVEIEVDDAAWSVFPFVQVGAGLAFLEKDNRSGDKEEFGALLNFGIGVRIPIDEQLFLSSTMLFNVIPGKIVDERFIYSWQVVQFEIRF